MSKFSSIFKPNYDKPGKGIEKDAPKKKLFFLYWETAFQNFWKFVPVNLLYWITSLFIVTNGMANAGLTHIVRNTALDKHSFGVSDYIDTIKKNWKQALPAGIINTVLYIIIFVSGYFYWFADGLKISTLGLGIIFSVFIIFKMMNFFIWTLMITFKFKLSNIYKNSFKFTIVNLMKNLLCLLIIGASYILMALIFQGATHFLGKFGLIIGWFEIVLYIISYPGLKFLLVQYLTFPSVKKYVIDPYYEEHPEEDIEKRKSLGLYEEKITEENEDIE